MRRLLTVLALTLPAMPAAGAQNMPGRWYLGAGYGETDIDATTALFGGHTVESTEDANTYFGGYRSGSVGIEAGRIDFGTFDATSGTGTPAGFTLEGDSLSVLLHWQLNRSISAFGRWGRLWWEGGLEGAGSTALAEDAESFRGIGLRFGVGAGLHVIVEQQTFQVGDLEPKVTSASLAWRF